MYLEFGEMCHTLICDYLNMCIGEICEFFVYVNWWIWIW